MKRERIRLHANESPYGPPPAAVAAMRRELAQVNYYPDSQCRELKQALARHLGCRREMIVAGNGGDNIINLVCRAFLGRGREAIIPDPAFSVYRSMTEIAGGRAVAVPLKDYRLDLAAMRRAITPQTGVIFLCNPHNPTGTTITAAESQEYLRGLPGGVVTVFDEAYHEFVDRPDCPDSVAFCSRGLSTLTLRTFSKVYGLAGLRLGYAVTRPDLAARLERFREPYAANRLAVVAATAALGDTEFVAMVKEKVRRQKNYLYRELTDLGIEYIPSEANFVLMRASAQTIRALARAGIAVRPGETWSLDGWARISVGRAHDLHKAIGILGRAVAGGR